MIYFNFPKSVYLKYREKINKTILNVLNSGNYVKSKELNKFEKKFAQYIKTKFAVGVGNATDAIFVALKALNIGYGDEVITVSHTATGTVMGILNTGIFHALSYLFNALSYLFTRYSYFSEMLFLKVFIQQWCPLRKKVTKQLFY